MVLIRIKVDSQGDICYREFILKEFELANLLVIDNEDNIFDCISREVGQGRKHE